MPFPGADEAEGIGEPARVLWGRFPGTQFGNLWPGRMRAKVRQVEARWGALCTTRLNSGSGLVDSKRPTSVWAAVRGTRSAGNGRWLSVRSAFRRFVRRRKSSLPGAHLRGSASRALRFRPVVRLPSGMPGGLAGVATPLDGENAFARRGRGGSSTGQIPSTDVGGPESRIDGESDGKADKVSGQYVSCV